MSTALGAGQGGAREGHWDHSASGWNTPNRAHSQFLQSSADVSTANSPPTATGDMSCWWLWKGLSVRVPFPR